MSSGTIKRLVRDRGFGFIRDDGGQEWFFHRSSVQGSFDQLNEGQRVTAGQQIAEMGHSGAASDMLHFEIRFNGKPVDPLVYLPKR